MEKHEPKSCGRCTYFVSEFFFFFFFSFLPLFFSSVVVVEEEEDTGGADVIQQRGSVITTVKKNDVHNSFLSPAVADGVFSARGVRALKTLMGDW